MNLACWLNGAKGMLLLILVAPAAFAERASTPPDGKVLDITQGKRVYTSSCANCHDTGRSGAPKLGEPKNWESRSFEWFSVMKNHASNGFLNMPPQAKYSQLSDDEIADAVFYITETLADKK